MSTPTEFYRWWIIDERAGKRRLTTYKLARANAADRYPGAEPDLQSREVRMLPDADEIPANSRAGRELVPVMMIALCQIGANRPGGRMMQAFTPNGGSHERTLGPD